MKYSIIASSISIALGILAAAAMAVAGLGGGLGENQSKNPAEEVPLCNIGVHYSYNPGPGICATKILCNKNFEHPSAASGRGVVHAKYSSEMEERCIILDPGIPPETPERRARAQAFLGTPAACSKHAAEAEELHPPCEEAVQMGTPGAQETVTYDVSGPVSPDAPDCGPEISDEDLGRSCVSLSPDAVSEGKQFAVQRQNVSSIQFEDMKMGTPGAPHSNTVQKAVPEVVQLPPQSCEKAVSTKMKIRVIVPAVSPSKATSPPADFPSSSDDGSHQTDCLETLYPHVAIAE